MWMREASNRLGLALKFRAMVGIVADVREENLNRDGTIEAGVTSFVDFTHPARTDHLEDLIATEPGAWSQRMAVGL
jgi:hypothetical protein